MSVDQTMQALHLFDAKHINQRALRLLPVAPCLHLLGASGPAFAVFGLGLTLYLASQGSGKVRGPVLASTLRLLLVGGIGAWLVAQRAPAWHYFVLVGSAMVIYGLSTAAASWFTPWGSGAARRGKT